MANPVTPIAFADSPRNGAWGDRPYSVADIQGPASYTPLVLGTGPAGGPLTCPTGGQPVGPSNFGLVAGLEGIDEIGGSTSGTYTVDCFQLNAYQSGSSNLTWTLRWNNSVTGAEAAQGTNLSGEMVRLRAFGPY